MIIQKIIPYEITTYVLCLMIDVFSLVHKLTLFSPIHSENENHYHPHKNKWLGLEGGGGFWPLRLKMKFDNGDSVLLV